jgi:hypothetical protein
MIGRVPRMICRVPAPVGKMREEIAADYHKSRALHNICRHPYFRTLKVACCTCHNSLFITTSPLNDTCGDISYISMSSIISIICGDLIRNSYNSALILHLRLHNTHVSTIHCIPASTNIVGHLSACMCILWRWSGWMCSLRLTRTISSET